MTMTNPLDFNQTHFTKLVLQSLGLAIAAIMAIMSWYLSVINSNIKELSKAVTELHTITVLTTARLDGVDKMQKDINVTFEIIKEKISGLEKEANSAKTVLSHHAALIADKRRCIACSKVDFNKINEGDEK